MKIIEYEDKYLEDVKDLLVELEKYILSIDKDYIKVTEGKNLKIEILKHDKIVESLINNMINLLTELQNDYKENIDIRRC